MLCHYSMHTYIIPKTLVNFTGTRCFFSVFFSVRLLSAWSFGFFIPATTDNVVRLRRIFYPRLYPLHLLSYLDSWERASIFPFECSVLNKGTTWYHFNNVFGMTRSLSGGLNLGPPALEASTLPLGYRGGDVTVKST